MTADSGALKLGGMWLRRLLAPLVRGTTYRRGVFLLLGGLLLAPYVALGVVFARLLTDSSVSRGATVLLLAATAAIAVVPPFLRGCRTLEIVAARSLLDVELPDPPHQRIDRDTRLRTGLWVGVHLVTGGLVTLGLITVLPMALILIARQCGIRVAVSSTQPFGPLEAHHGVDATLISVLALMALVYCIAGLGGLARSMAPTLLGPSQLERIASLEAQAGRLAERDRLARELHDSIGHTLTVTTLQAAAARKLLDSDIEFAREALRTIEETGRGAMGELDYVLGLLHERDPAETASPRTTAGGAMPASRPTLADFDRLVAETRAAGVTVIVEVRGHLDEVPFVVSREGYRIVQEGLTNAARHADGAEVTLRVTALDEVLNIDLVNVAGAESRQRGGGRGLAGMRERVQMLGGSMSAGHQDGVWRVSVRLPAPRGGAA